MRGAAAATCSCTTRFQNLGPARALAANDAAVSAFEPYPSDDIQVNQASSAKDGAARVRLILGRSAKPLILPAIENGDRDALRSQGLPNCAFALLTHASFAGPASA